MFLFTSLFFKCKDLFDKMLIAKYRAWVKIKTDVGAVMNFSREDVEVDGNGSAGFCRRCGTCCRKGGPALHACDKPLVDEGKIKIADIYTIREGEPVFDNVRGRLATACSDIIKIKSIGGSSICLFYEASDSSCLIYDWRPVECRILKCWAPGDIEKEYSRNRLSRKDLLSGMPGMWDLVKAHHQECSYTAVGKMVKKGDMKGLSYLVRYDLHFRNLALEKGRLDRAVLDFLFGLPLVVTIRRYGIDPQQLLVGENPD
ncbi:MAG: hypothetical protein DRH32_06005 [Deltaproteobacteria bacterium]|nr:MAG: hypothetical protein DRH32_06005 [Deltaproteobacteria bacterium]